MSQRPAYEIMPVAASDPESLIEDMHGYDAERDRRNSRYFSDMRSRAAINREKAYSSEAEPRHRLGNDLEPD